MAPNALRTVFMRLAAGLPKRTRTENAHAECLRSGMRHGLPRVMHDIIAVRQLLASDTGTFQSMPDDL